MKKLVCIFFALLFTGSSLFSQSREKEYALKAAFIYNFTLFIEWNSNNTGNEFVIGVFGSSPIYEPLMEIARTKTVHGKKIIIREYNSLDETGNCQILFISQKNSYSLSEILEKVNAKGTLIISEQDGYAALGADINFVIINNKIKFEIYSKSINKSDFTMSSQLLKLALIVN